MSRFRQQGEAVRAQANKEREQNVAKGQHERNAQNALRLVGGWPVEMHDHSLVQKGARALEVLLKKLRFHRMDPDAARSMFPQE